MKTSLAFGAIAVVLAGCNMNDSPASSRPAIAAPQTQTATEASVTPRPTAAPAERPALDGGAQTAASLDTTTPEEKAAAAAPASGGGKLGTSVASLGDATEGGFWVKSPLVKAEGKGRVVNIANGKSANVDLKPLAGSGAGSQLSLAAMQAIGAGLTDLPDIEVWQN
ncbi:hypothetical protein FQV27_06885 [Paracoccus aurantiacus]|uniref:D-galactarate dehydratase n=2 Tax=Paracoccus aurantiacus TaxID=2599412 RepID=A0A5C6S6R9_9RHOB|nr:hypothetical protein FQV27_06885 [Paracoccus aurantiacus]